MIIYLSGMRLFKIRECLIEETWNPSFSLNLLVCDYSELVYDLTGCEAWIQCVKRHDVKPMVISPSSFQDSPKILTVSPKLPLVLCHQVWQNVTNRVVFFLLFYWIRV